VSGSEAPALVTLKLNGILIDPDKSYKIVTNAFLAVGCAAGGRLPGFDINLIAYCVYFAVVRCTYCIRPAGSTPKPMRAIT